MSFDRAHHDGFGGRPGEQAEPRLDEPYGARALGATTDAPETRWVQLKPEAGAVGDVSEPVAVSGPGAPLAPELRGRMEAGFGQDFSSVRVHEDPAAVQALGAQGFAQGEQVVVGQGQATDQKLIGHELAHVVQQRDGRVATPQGKDAAVVVDAALEAEADAAADRVLAGGKADLSRGGSAPATGAAPIQGYSIRRNWPGRWRGLPGKSRVSADGTMAVLDRPPPGRNGVANPKAFFATEGRLASAQEALLRNGSPYQLVAGDEQARGPAPDDSGTRELVSVKMINTSQDGRSTTPKQCNENMSTVLGLKGVVEGAQNRLGVITGQDELTPARNDDYDHVFKEVGRGQKESQDPKAYSRDHLTDHNARPEAGDGIGIRGESGQGHFAGVLARALEDYVTLENDAAQSGPMQDNGNWYFRMYGAVKTGRFGRKDKSQTFLGQQKKTGAYGQHPLVLALRKRARDATDALSEFLTTPQRTSVKASVASLGPPRNEVKDVTLDNLVERLNLWIQQLEEELELLREKEVLPKEQGMQAARIQSVETRIQQVRDRLELAPGFIHEWAPQQGGAGEGQHEEQPPQQDDDTTSEGEDEE